MNMFLIIVLVFFICLPLVLVWKRCSYEHFTIPVIEYISKEQFDVIVNRSPYFKRMSDLDLLARNTSSIEQYIYTYKEAYEPFTTYEKKILEESVASLSRYIKVYKRLQRLPWKFAKVNVFVENGFPHTLEDTIILSDDFFGRNKLDIQKTLLHEQVHVYQRKYPEETAILMQMWGFNKCKVSADIKSRTRNNPDIEDVYCHDKSTATLQIYKNNTPVSLTDSASKKYNIFTHEWAENDVYPEYIHQTEHPFEAMASIIPLIVFDNKTDYLSKITKQWMLAYL